MKMLDILPVVVKQEYLLSFLIVFRTNVRKFVPHPCTDDVNANLEILFKSWNECISEWFVDDHVHHFTYLFSQCVLSSFFIFYTGPCNTRVDTADEAIEFHRMSESDDEP